MPVGDGTGLFRIPLRLGPDGSLLLPLDPAPAPNADVTLVIPEGTTAGQVLPAVLRLVRRDVVSIGFDDPDRCCSAGG